jgi:hypothetical protein
LKAVRDYLDRFWETVSDNFAILSAAEAEADNRKRSASKKTDTAALARSIRSTDGY